MIATRGPMTRRSSAKKNTPKHKPPAAQRPYMPGYGLPKGRQGLLPWAWAEQRLRRSHNYWLVTTKPDGAPHAMPGRGIWGGSVFYFGTGRRSRKARNLAQNARCVVCNERADEAVIVEGVAEEIDDPKLIAKLARPYGKKYAPWQLTPALG